MTFQNTWPLAFLILVPVIVFFYILKQRAKDREFSSTLLWREVYRNIQASTPFEKFRHNILMYLQLLLLLLLIAALMAPAIKNAGKAAANVVVVIDSSASMSCAYDDETRLDEAKSRAQKLVASLDDRDAVTVVSCASEANVIYQGTDKDSVSERIAGISQTYEEGSLADAETLVSSLVAGMTNPVVYCYTDTAFDAQALVGAGSGAGCEVVSVYSEAENCSVDYVNYTVKDNTDGSVISSLASVTNYGGKDRELDVTLYADDEPVCLRSVTVAAGQSEIVYFDDITLSSDDTSTVLTAKTDGGDALSADDSQSVVVSESAEKSVLLVSTGNVFLEKALALDDNVTVYKTDSMDSLTGEDGGYDLYVFDGTVSTSGMTLSECGIEDGAALLFMGTDEVFVGHDEYVKSTGSAENVYLSFVQSGVTEYVEDYTFGVTKSYVYELPQGAETCIETDDGRVAGYTLQTATGNIAVLGFDVHDTDLALRAEFPMFMSQLGSSLMGMDDAGVSLNNFPASESQVVPAEDLSVGGTHGQRGLSDRSLKNYILAAVILLLILEWIVYVILSNSKKKYQYLALRVILLIITVLAMLNLSVTLSGRNRQTIFLVDVSDSASADEDRVAEYIAESVGEKPDDDSYAVVLFGENTAVQQFMTKAGESSGFTATAVSSSTNIENALVTASAMFDDGASKRLILITDGEENSGSMNKAAVTLAGSDVSLAVVKLDSSVSGSSEVYIDDMQVPDVIHEGDRYNVTVSVMSNVETDAKLTLYDGRTVKEAKDIHVTKGENRFVFAAECSSGTVARYKAVIEPDTDTIAVNNTYVTYAETDAVPKVLIVLGNDEEKGKLSSVLDAANIDCDEVYTSGAPRSISDMTEYKAVITVNCHYDDLPENFVKNLVTFVRDYTGGYICVGGDDSYALGGYRDTELEEILPVNVDLQGENEIPEMAMVMAIDHSGSMSSDSTDGSGLSSLTLAKQAAISATDELRDTDQVGIMEFDDAYKWVYELSGVGDGETVKEAVRTIPLGGGTSIYPAVMEAYNALEASDASIKHFVLLTDGEDDTLAGRNDAIAKLFNDAGITLSTVAVGSGSDLATLRTLADSCGGRYYYTDVNNSIPRIFAQEVYLSTNEYLQNREFYPQITSRSEIADGVFDGGMPALYGYISTTAKSTADVVLASDTEEPILASWQYGLGRTIAWCSDGSFNWTAGCAEWESYPQLWSNMVNYVITNTASGEDTVSVSRSGSGNILTYETEEYGSETEVSAVITDEDGQQTEVTLTAVKPGTYQADIDLTEVGVYSVNVRRYSGDNLEKTVGTAFANQYSSEYRFGSGANGLSSLVSMTDADEITFEDDVWQLEGSEADVRKSLTVPLLIIAVLLLMADIACRRLAVAPFGWTVHLGRGVRRAVSAVGAAAGKRAQRPAVENAWNTTDTHETVKEDSVNKATASDAPAPKKVRRSDKKESEKKNDMLDMDTLLKKKHDRE